MDELELAIIEKVKSRPFLYDKGHDGFMDPKLKQDTWEQIAGEMREKNIAISAALCQEIWSQLKTKFAALNRQCHDLTRSGAAYPEDFDFALFEQLQFLKPHIDNRKIVSTIRKPKKSSLPSVWSNPWAHQKKVDSYSDLLPPTVPQLDQFAIKKLEYRDEILEDLEQCGSTLQELTDAFVAESAEDNDPWFQILYDIMIRMTPEQEQLYFLECNDLLKTKYGLDK